MFDKNSNEVSGWPHFWFMRFCVIGFNGLLLFLGLFKILNFGFFVCLFRRLVFNFVLGGF